MGAYASLEDVLVDVGEVESAEHEKVETLIDRAEARIEQVMGPIPALLASNRTNVVIVKQVISEMVAVVLRNPEGVRSVSESVGPFSRSTGFGGSFTTGVDAGFGTLDLTTRQRVLLGGSKSGSVGPRLGGPGGYPVSSLRFDT